MNISELTSIYSQSDSEKYYDALLFWLEANNAKYEALALTVEMLNAQLQREYGITIYQTQDQTQKALFYSIQSDMSKLTLETEQIKKEMKRLEREWERDFVKELENTDPFTGEPKVKYLEPDAPTDFDPDEREDNYPTKEELDAISFSSPDNRSPKHWQEAEAELEELFTELKSQEQAITEKEREIAELKYTEETAQNFIGGVLEALENGSAKTIDERSEKYYEYEQYAQETEESNNYYNAKAQALSDALHNGSFQIVSSDTCSHFTLADFDTMSKLIDVWESSTHLKEYAEGLKLSMKYPNRPYKMFREVKSIDSAYGLYLNNALFLIEGNGKSYNVSVLNVFDTSTLYFKSIDYVSTLSEALGLVRLTIETQKA